MTRCIVSQALLLQRRRGDGLMMVAWLAVRSRAVITRCVVPCAVSLPGRRSDGVGALMRKPALVSATSARLWQRRFKFGGCVMLRERSLKVRVPRLVSASVIRA